MTEEQRPRVWLTYSWADNQDSDFDYLVGQLTEVGVEARYDRISLGAGGRLWDQIADQIINGGLDGWAYLLTPSSLASQPCREELAYAIERALGAKGNAFPLIGLSNGVLSEMVPAALKVRLYVSLSDPDWRERVKSALQCRPPNIAARPASRYAWRLYPGWNGNPDQTAIEVRLRFGEVGVWRFTTLADATIVECATGPAGMGPMDGIWFYQVNTTLRATFQNGTSLLVRYVGCANPVSPGRSAWIVFEGAIPPLLIFGPAESLEGGAKIGDEQEQLPETAQIITDRRSTGPAAENGPEIQEG